MRKVTRIGFEPDYSLPHVAVIVSYGYGAGWYSWHGIEELLYLPELVDLIENNKGLDYDEHCTLVRSVIAEQFGEDYADEIYLTNLSIVWVPEGEEFIIEEYDGAESIRFKSATRWLKA